MHDEAEVAVRAMLVEHDPDARERIATAIRSDARMLLVGWAATADEALARLEVLQPDILLVGRTIARLLLDRVQPQTVPAATAGLTARESDVLHLLGRGLSYSQIGERLGVSLNTVASHIKNAYRKLDVHSAAAAVMRVVELQLPGKE